jgi:alanyl-tRNA synthetase
VIEQEEISFLRTLEGGIKRFDTLKAPEQIISGKDAFELYDTYGFPIDLTRLMATEKGWTIDEKGFEQALAEQKQRSRSDAILTTGDWIQVIATAESPVFEGYDQDELSGVKLVKYRSVEDRDGVYFQLVLDRTSFYPEGGGQVGDQGKLVFGNESIEVLDVVKENDLPIHLAKRMPSDLTATVVTQIDSRRRRLIENNHSATHLLHAALREVLGDHVQQRGSLLNEEYLRFDFSHFSKVTPEELHQIESRVNQKIREDIKLGEERNIPISQAEKSGARMLFGEKYGETVRMITFDPTYSIELCGGCHVPATGHIGYFKITSESAVAAGVRRIEAITADAAESYINDQLNQLSLIRQELKNPSDVIKTIRELTTEVKELKQQLETIEVEKAGNIKTSLLETVEMVNGIHLLSHAVDIQDQKLLKNLIYQIGNELQGESFLLLGSSGEGKAQLMQYIREDLVKSKKLHAGHIIKELAKSISGGGGGQPFFASAGGTSPDGLEDALGRARSFIEN